jgi:hypothetical protein
MRQSLYFQLSKASGYYLFSFGWYIKTVASHFSLETNSIQDFNSPRSSFNFLIRWSDIRRIFFSWLGIEPRASKCLLGKHFGSWVMLLVLLSLFCFRDEVLLIFLRLASNSRYSCLHPWVAGIITVCKHSHQENSFQSQPKQIFFVFIITIATSTILIIIPITTFLYIDSFLFFTRGFYLPFVKSLDFLE